MQASGVKSSSMMKKLNNVNKAKQVCIGSCTDYSTHEVIISKIGAGGVVDAREKSIYDNCLIHKLYR